MDTASIIVIITTVSSLILNIYQVVKSSHFKSTCGKCCSVESDLETRNLRTSNDQKI